MSEWIPNVVPFISSYLDLNIVFWIGLLVLLWLIYMLYQCYFGGIGKQSIWPNPKMPKAEEFISFMADQVMDADKMFIIKMPGTKNFKSVFDNVNEQKEAERLATNFFKKQFGLSDAYLNVFMKELRVNDEAGYHANYIKSMPERKIPLVDGGYAVYVLPNKKLYGQYGGRVGVSSQKSGILAFGYYKMANMYKIRYWSMCPLTTYMTYDGNYTIVDCDIEIEDAPNRSLVGLKGKAQGIYRTTKLNRLNHLTIRNVLTFN